MKKSIIATTILLLISVALVSLTFGIGERMTILSYNNDNTYNADDEDPKNHRIDMYNPDSLSLVTSKPIYDYDLSSLGSDMNLTHSSLRAISLLPESSIAASSFISSVSAVW